MAQILVTYGLWFGAVIPGEPLGSIENPNLTINTVDFPPDNDLLIGKAKGGTTSALFARFNITDGGKIPRGARIDIMNLRLMAEAVSTPEFDVDVAALRRDGFWNERVYTGSSESVGVDCGGFSVKNAGGTKVLETPALVGVFSRQVKLIVAFGTQRCGQCILNDSAETSFKFVEFEISRNADTTGGFVVEVYAAAEDDGSDDRAVGTTPLFTTDSLDIATAIPTLGTATTVEFEFASAITHPIGTKLVYLIFPDYTPDTAHFISVHGNNVPSGGIDDFGSMVSNHGNGLGIGFADSVYSTGYDFLQMHDQDGTYIPGTAKQSAPAFPKIWEFPHSDRLTGVAMPPFLVAGDTYTVTGLAPLLQRWIDDPRYPYEGAGEDEPFALILSGDSTLEDEDEREVQRGEDAAELVVIYTEPFVGCPNFSAAISDPVTMLTLLGDGVSMDAAMADPVSSDVFLGDGVSMDVQLRNAISMSTRLC